MKTGWLALVPVCLGAPQAAAQVINEIMYHAVEETATGVEDKRFEWIELHNDHADPVDLSGYILSGVSYVFPEGTFMPGRSFLVLAGDAAAVAAKYGISGVQGNWDPSTALDNAGEEITLANVSGLVISEVSYNDRGRWPAGADGTGHSLALRSPHLEVDEPDSWAISAQLGGTPGGPNFGAQSGFRDTVILKDDEMWRYLKGTAAPPLSWNEPGFNDSAWAQGRTGIGYGDGDDRTELTDMQGGYVAFFCRKRFTVADPSEIDRLILEVAYDDGFVVYLNGTEVASRNVASKTWDSPATATVSEASPEEFDITAFKSELLPGENLLSAQVHNSSLSASTDASFIPRLISREDISPQGAAGVPVAINEALVATAGERWLELYNRSAAAVDLTGFHITDDRRDLKKALLPAGSIVPASGWLVFTDAELGLNLSLAVPAARDRVFTALADPSGRVIDAYTFKPGAAELSEARFPDGGENVEPAAAPTRGARNRVDVVGDGALVINEIMYHPITGDPNDEYVEIYNRGSAAVGMLGFQLTKGIEYAFPDISLDPGQYLVVARDPDRIASTYGLPSPQVLGPWYRLKLDQDGNPQQEPASLADSGERITLADRNGNTADTVRYAEGGEWSFWPDGRGSSLELIDPFQDNDTPQAWDASDDSAKSAPTRFSYTGRHAGGESELHLLLLDRGIAVVDNVSVRAGATEHAGNGEFESDANAWRIEGTHVNSGHTADPELVISGDGSLKIVATGSGDNKVNRLETELRALSTATAYTISFDARWIVGSRALMSRGYNHGMARSHFLEVPADLGTPGRINSVTARQAARVGRANLGPVIDQVGHDPVVPEANEPVTVSARIRDSHGILPGSAKLFYATESPPPSTAGFTAVNMSDPDGDGRYTATIPGRPLNTRVLFFITAQDDSAEQVAGRFPLDFLERTHPAVLDPAAAATAEQRYAIYRHDTRLPGTRYESYRFVMHDLNELYLFNRPVHSNDLIDGSFIFGAERGYYGARIRWAGSPWLRGSRNWGNSYRVRFAGDDLLHGSIKSFNLENHATDGRERISHYLIRHQNRPGLRVPYADPWYARWQVNGDVNSTYEHVPQPDNEYLSAWYPDEDDGDFFEMDDRFEFNDAGDKVSNQDGRMTYPPYANSIYPTPDPAQGYASWKENYRWYLNLRAKPNADDFTSLIEFSRILDPSRTSSAVFDQEIGGYADVEAMLRTWAVRLNIDDWDQWSGTRGKNCYLYRRPVSGLWVLLPWDMELTYGNVNAFPLGATPSQPIPISGMFPEVNRMLNRPAIKRRFYGILKEMVDYQFNSGFLTPWMDLLSANGTGSTGIGRPGGFIDQRAQLIRGWIAPAVYPQQRLTITTSSGNNFISAGQPVEIDGEAPVEVYQIVTARDGVALDPQPSIAFSSTNMKGWTAEGIELIPGVNRLSFLGYDSAGNLIDSDSIEVSYNVNWDPPAIDSLDPTREAAGSSIGILGSGFHNGVQVMFGAIKAPAVGFNETVDPGRINVVVPAGLPAGPVMVRVENIDGKSSNEIQFTVLSAFIRGDANLSGGLDVGDPVKVLLYAFGGVPATCLDALDADDSGAIDITDALRLLEYLFRSGPAPLVPFPNRGGDLTADALNCAQGL